MFIREVRTENGWVRGLQAGDPRITAYKGIPFAAPPIGENRWRAPQPCADWEGTLNCFDFRPISMQDIPPLDEKNVYTREWSIDPDLQMSEDCLYLNIWAPAHPSVKNLPVFVWYFGGALQVGHPSEMEFDGERLARRGVIVVTANYRLNAFGFLSHPDLTAAQPDAPANFGHLDQQAAVRWVKRNIAAFGGDANNITLGGQSAGGASVMAQLTSPQNFGLFQRAIIESGMFLYPYPTHMHFGSTPSLSAGEAQGEAFLRALGVSGIREARALDARTILQKVIERHDFFSTVTDGRFCVGNPSDLFMADRRVRGPVLWGRTASEFFLSPDVDDINALQALAKERFKEDADAFLRAVGAPDGALDDIKKRAAVSCMELALRVLSAKSKQAGAKDALYCYTFGAEIPGWDNMGAFHSVDLWFFFETLAKCWRPFVGKHYDLARQMCTYWANFIKNGNPNGLDADGTPLPKWDEWTPDKCACMAFGDTAREKNDMPSELMQILMRSCEKRS